MNYEMVNTEAVLVTHQHGGKGNPITRDVLEGQTNLVLHSSLGVTEPNLSTAVDKLWEGKGYLLHKVEVTDTLWGLSIRYNVSADQIRRANNMSTDDIYFLKELIIPNPSISF